MKKNTINNCRIGGNGDETITYIVSHCPVLAKKEYIHKQDRVETYTHRSLSQ